MTRIMLFKPVFKDIYLPEKEVHVVDHALHVFCIQFSCFHNDYLYYSIKVEVLPHPVGVSSSLPTGRTYISVSTESGPSGQIDALKNEEEKDVKIPYPSCFLVNLYHFQYPRLYILISTLSKN